MRKDWSWLIRGPVRKDRFDEKLRDVSCLRAFRRVLRKIRKLGKLMSKRNKIAVLMLCHVLPEQINDFINRLNREAFEFFLHVDKKSDIQPLIHKKETVHFVPDDRRVDVRWGTYSVVQATLELLSFAMQTGSYDYFWLCSGQDFPIKSTKDIEEFFEDKECNFITFSSSANNPVNGYRNTRFDKRCEIGYPLWIIGKSLWQRVLKRIYCIVTGGTGYTFKAFRRVPPLGLRLFFGSQWWCLNRETIKWVLDFIKDHIEFCDFFTNTLCPDESFFQSIVMSSPYATAIEPNLVYIDWSAGKNSPKILTVSDYERVKSSGKLIARKIDSNREPDFYHMLTHELTGDSPCAKENKG